MDSKALWNWCKLHGKVVDVYIAKKLSKVGKRFGFIRFIEVEDDLGFTKQLSREWIGSFHIFVSVAKFKRPNTNTTHVVKPNNENKSPEMGSKGSYANVVSEKNTKSGVGAVKLMKDEKEVKRMVLNENDLVKMDDSAEVVLAKIREVEAMAKLYGILENEGFNGFEAHHVGGLWVWIEFNNQKACQRFKDMLKNRRFCWRDFQDRSMIIQAS
ncbi:RNA-directed DNA polymerase, eukaryota [Tanacetum coccineum]|uniref:RNA-directed DNA polymerase, eukaryota n=1 Tax=Tanacetum coccineum TaxID=301880 RepID=A0ABQ5HJ16_9ASTR